MNHGTVPLAHRFALAGCPGSGVPDRGIVRGTSQRDALFAMLHTYPLDPNRRGSPGILDVVRRYAEELAVSGRNPRTPASRTQAGAGLLVTDRHPVEPEAR